MPIFLLTDIEKSTEKWEKYRGAMSPVLARHDAILRNVIESFDGEIFKHTGDGIFAIFEQGAPLHCAIEIQKSFAAEDWGQIGELRVRIAVHAGEVEKRGKDYFGEVLNRTARIMETAWGGQILLTPEAANSCSLPNNAEVRDLGIHMLLDLGEPQPIYQLMHPELPIKDFPAIRSLSAHPHNLPSQPTPFIGREKEVQEISKYLDDPKCRIVNLVGPGGIGKTRLALQVAAEKIDKFRHGVYFIPLDSMNISSVQFLVFTIADALKFSFYSREDPKLQLLNYLREKHMLMLLDNFEHLISEAELLTEIFENARRIKFLVTSRERLHLKGEWIIDIAGMDYPTNGNVEEYNSYSAIQLFINSAQRVKPDFSISSEDQRSIGRICRLVDGIPLGIELAASWVRSLSCAEICQEIEKGLDFLSTNLRDMPKRHQSLRAVFDYSWDLLSAKEQKIFISLGVFKSSFTREAAEKVTGASLRELSNIADKSLIRRNAQGRYEMLKILRQYASERLSENETLLKKLNSLHSAYFAELLSNYESLLKSNTLETLRSISLDLVDLKAAWRYSIENQMLTELDKMMKGLYFYYEMQGWLHEAEQVFRMTVEMFRIKYSDQWPSDDAKLLFARYLMRLGGIYRRLSQYETARTTLKESLAIFHEYNQEKDSLYAFNELGVIAYRLGDYKNARELHQKVLDIRTAMHDQRGIATSLNNLAVVAFSQGNHEEAKSLHEKALQIREQINDRRGVATSMNNLGNVLHKIGESEKAQELYEKSLAIREEIGDRAGIASSLNNLGMIHEENGDYEKAQVLYRQSLVLKEEIGDLRSLANTLHNLGNMSFKTEKINEAGRYYRRALTVSLKAKAIPAILDVLNSMVELFKIEDKYDVILLIYYIIKEQPSSRPDIRAEAEKKIRILEEKTGKEQASTIKEKLAKKSLENIIEEIAAALSAG